MLFYHPYLNTFIITFQLKNMKEVFPSSFKDFFNIGSWKTLFFGNQ